jgi:hypothetical protein
MRDSRYFEVGKGGGLCYLEVGKRGLPPLSVVAFNERG